MTEGTPYGVLWELELLSFQGIVGGASHWFAKLHGRTQDVAVQARIDAAMARALSTRDFTYRVGWESDKFLTRDDAVAAGVAVFRHMAGERDVLIEKYADEGQVLAGPDDLVAEGGKRHDTGGAWWDWRKRFIPHVHPTQYGYNAPPSPRRALEIVVRRDGDGWTVEP